MYTRVANRLALKTESITGWIACYNVVTGCIDPPNLEVEVCPPAIVIRDSQPVTMEGANAVRFDATVITIKATNAVQILLQGSNDLENWEQVTTATTDILSMTAPGYYVSELFPDVAFQYVRLRYRMWEYYDEFNPADPDYAVVSAGLIVFAN